MRRDSSTSGCGHLSRGSGYLAYLSVGSRWVILAFFVYGTIYSSCDARWHECAHGTPFRTRWLNETFYLLSCLMNMKEGTFTRWSHTRHHTETIMVGLDPEIQVMRPADLSRVLLDFLWIPDAIHMFRVMIFHAAAVPAKKPESSCRKASGERCSGGHALPAGLCRNDRLVNSHAQLASAAVFSAGATLWRMAASTFLSDSARGPGRECA